MGLRNRRLSLITAVFVFFLFVSVGRSADIPEKPQRYVVDLAGIVDDGVENRLNGYLQELEQKTTAQMIILTISSLEGESIEDLSITIAHDKWKLGQKGKDNGLLFLISVKDRKYRIEVGYGLEGVLPDSLVGSLGRDLLVPYFRKGDYSNGIFATTLAMANKIAADAGVKIEGMPSIKYPTPPTGKPGGPLSTIIGIVFLIIMGILFIKNPRAFLLFLLFSSMGGRRGSWGGGGGFGGGGFGSFGGGGGGFGGGGHPADGS